MGHHIIDEVKQEKFIFSRKAKLIPILLIVLGAILAGVGAMQVRDNWDNLPQTEEHATDADSHDTHAEEEGHGDHHQIVAHAEGEAHTAPHEAAHGDHAEVTWMTRVWANLLMNSYYFWLFAVGALFFIAVNYVANAGWAVMLKRIMEAQTAYLFVGSIILFLVIYFGADFNYHHWIPYFDSDIAGNTKSPDFDAILESKHWLLNKGAIFGFVPFVLIVWYGVRFKLRKNSVAEDKTKGLSMFKNSTRWSAFFIFFFAFSFSALSWLIIMSIDAHW